MASLFFLSARNLTRQPMSGMEREESSVWDRWSAYETTNSGVCEIIDIRKQSVLQRHNLLNVFGILREILNHNKDKSLPVYLSCINLGVFAFAQYASACACCLCASPCVQDRHLKYIPCLPTISSQASLQARVIMHIICMSQVAIADHLTGYLPSLWNWNVCMYLYCNLPARVVQYYILNQRHFDLQSTSSSAEEKRELGWNVKLNTKPVNSYKYNRLLCIFA